MGKHGPCYHCGVTSTPLWRNGPPEKPVLCNACGSRWRTKGTLANYTPLHARVERDEFDNCWSSKVKNISMQNKEVKCFKRKFDNSTSEFGWDLPDYSPGLHKVFDKDTSNGSSSGSAISNSESCAQYGSTDASDMTGASQPILWDTLVPSKKRTFVTRVKPSQVEMLTKDLYTIWNEQQWSSLSGSSEEDLLLESGKPMVSVEIGHGSVLIRHPSSIAREEESEASSLSIDNKQHAMNSKHLNFSGLVEDTGVNSSNPGIQKIKKLADPEIEQMRRDKDHVEKQKILGKRDSPLCQIDMQDVLNVDKFVSHFTVEEQRQLLKYLPSIDSSAPHQSAQFKEKLLSFQKLLSEGVFDYTFSGFKIEDVRTFKKNILCNLPKSKWVEQHQIFKDVKEKNSVNESEAVRVSSFPAADYSTTAKISEDKHFHYSNLAGVDSVTKIPRDISTKTNCDQKKVTEIYGSLFSPKRLFASPNDYGSGSDMLDTSHFSYDGSDQDLLLDVPSNGSFPQAELLPPASGFGAQATTSTSSIYPNP